MKSIASALLLTFTLFSSISSAFFGTFKITNLVIDSPSEAQATSTINSTGDSFITFDFSDEDTPDIAPVHCSVDWKAGESPVTEIPRACANNTFTVQIPADGYNGFANFTLVLSHSYIDPAVGEAPWNVLTKFGMRNITSTGIDGYRCDVTSAACQLDQNAELIVNITTAVA